MAPPVSSRSKKPSPQIIVLFADKTLVVIHKPPLLRSVPGHAAPISSENIGSSDVVGKKRSQQQQQQEDEEQPRRTAQEAWEEAIRSYSQDEGSSLDCEAAAIIRNLATMPSLSSVPRKWKPFHRYCIRNQRKLLRGEGDSVDGATTRWSDEKLEPIVKQAHEWIHARQRPLLNLPTPTRHEESALGQLILLGYANERSEGHQTSSTLFVVHRLDCETCGVMVFARTKEAASKLGKAWRERDQVSKMYYAKVRKWPPFEVNGESQGRIDVPLAPSQERLKWTVVDDKDDIVGKPSTTLWKVVPEDSHAASGILLALTPVTGRTHQLRIHCAHVGSGIDGDSLYGDRPIQMGNPADPLAPTLALYAHKLVFPHPVSDERVEFVGIPPAWIEGRL